MRAHGATGGGGLGHADNSFRAPMAAAVIGGLITSTILSLLVTPSFSTIVDDIEHFFAVAKAKVTGLVQRVLPQKA